MTSPRTLFDKIWDSHIVEQFPDGTALLYVDRHLLDELHSPQAFAALRSAGRVVRRPDATIAVAEHCVPTERSAGIVDPASRILVETLEGDTAEFGVPYIQLSDERQGIVHVIGPELGLSLPGILLVSGDSHASTHGALGTLAFGVGASDVAQVLATQTLTLRKPRTMQLVIEGLLSPGIAAKDLALAAVASLGSDGAIGHVIEFCGEAVRGLDMAGRMTLCNMAIEAGAHTALIAPDEVTFDYLQARHYAPSGNALADATAYWRTLSSDPGACHDKTATVDAADIGPMVTWGTCPDTALPITSAVPDPSEAADDETRKRWQRMRDYMDLVPGQRLRDLPIDVVFIGSCSNGRIEDIRAAAAIAEGHKVAPGVRARVVPGSGLVKRQAEREGLDRILLAAGFEWRAPGCSMCIAMNGDRLSSGQRCASTSNRNFEQRQGPGGRTHLVSPAMAAAAAVAGRLVDVRELP